MATGGPFTQAATTGVDDSYIPMADPSTPVQDVVTEESFSPDLGLPRIMQDDGIPMDYLNQSFSAPIEPGQDPLQAAPQQPAEQPMAPQQVEKDQGVATPGYQPKPEGGRSRASLSAPQFNQKYRYTQEDFYGAQKAQKAPITWTDPRGVQMHVPQAGRLPMAIFASRMQQVQGERAENKQNLQKFIDGLGSPKTADPYQSSLNESVSLARDKFVNDLAAQYGGNTALAWKEIANDPNTQKRFRDMHIRFEAIGQKGQWAWDRARSYLDAIEKGGVFVHPETKKQAEDIYYGLGSMRGDEDVADIDKLTRDINKFEHSVSRDEYAKKWVLPDLEKMYAQHASNVTAKRLNSDVGTVSWEDQKSLSDSFYQAIAASMTDTIPGTTMAENKEWLKGLLPPDKVQLQLRTYSPKDPKESGGGGGGAENTPLVTAALSERWVKDGSGRPSTEPYLRMTPIQMTGDKPHKVIKMNVSAGEASVDLYAPALVWDEENGGFFIKGKDLSIEETKKLNDILAEYPNGENAESILTTEKFGKPASVSTHNNKDALQIYFKTRDEYEVIARLLNERGISATSSEVKKKWAQKENRDSITNLLGL